jgi:methylated-DNA-protein-cysteine methyltransferase-like protein
MDTDERNRRIYAVIESIPAGTVVSYGQVAEIAGIPRGARQVAYALRCLPRGHALPWFRIITASGRLAFPADSEAFKRQRNRLRDEGVIVTDGRVDMARFRWQPDLDELLWKPDDSWDEGDDA